MSCACPRDEPLVNAASMARVRPAPPGMEWYPLAPPALGAAVDFQDGLRWLRIPLPGRLDHINVWLLPAQGSGWWLVDTGMGVPVAHAAWDALVQEHALESTLRGILVTHHHPDHFGMAAALATRCDVEVRMSREAHRAGGWAYAGNAPELLASFGAHWGLDYARVLDQANARHLFRQVISGVPPVTQPLEDGEVLTGTDLPWSVTLHDGHAEGHACLYAATAGLFIAGDELLPTISSNVSVYAQSGLVDPLEDHFKSVRRLRMLSTDTLVLPAHGRPFYGAHARLDLLEAEHAARLVEILEHASEPCSAMEMSTKLFRGRTLDGMNQLLALGETIAHLHYLERRGELQRVEVAHHAAGQEAAPRFIRATLA